MATRPVSKTAFKRALELIGKPGGWQLKFLQAHYSSPGRASTATNLAWAAGYKNFNALNLQYGTLARRIGEALGMNGATLGLLLEFNEPFTITNEHWILSMRPEFAMRSGRSAGSILEPSQSSVISGSAGWKLWAIGPARIISAGCHA